MTSTIVSFHAHPDDEAITVGGTLAIAADAGHRVVLVFGTRGDLGEVDDGVLEPDEALGQRREQEARDAAAVLGAARVEFLPYHDSGMAGESTNDAADAFAAADVEEAAGPSRRAPARGARRRAHRVRRARRLRPPRPHPGARRRSSRRRTRGHAARLRGDHQPGALPRPRRTPHRPGPARHGASRSGGARPRRARGPHHHHRRRHRRARSQAGCDGRAPVADQRRVVLPRAAAGGVRDGVRDRVVHPPRRDARRARVLDPRRSPASPRARAAVAYDVAAVSSVESATSGRTTTARTAS